MATRLPLLKPLYVFLLFFLSVSLYGQTQNDTDSLIHYWMKFPADIETQCSEVMDLTNAIGENLGCGLLAIGFTDERFDHPAGGGCYRIHRTYRVINWCEYRGQAAPVVVSRDWDAWNGTNPGRCSVPSPYGNGTPGDSDFYIYVKKDLRDNQPDTVWYDSDNNPYNGLPDNPDTDTVESYFWRVISGSDDPGEEDYYEGNCSTWSYDNNQTDSDIMGNIALDDNDRRYGSFGYWLYTQYITVFDNVAPTVDWNVPDTLYTDSEEDCSTTLIVPLEVTDSCSNVDPDVKIYLDLNNDGKEVMDVTFFWDGTSFGGRYSAGTHKLSVVAEDDCGNVTNLERLIIIIDGIAPTPVCHDNIVVELGRQGDDPAIFAEVGADDLIASAIFDCSGQSDSLIAAGGLLLVTDYSINLVGDPVDRQLKSITFDCNDLEVDSIPVEVHAWDGAGNSGHCVTSVFVQDNKKLCTQGQVIELAGTVHTESDMPLENIEIKVSGGFTFATKTDAQGQFKVPLLSNFRTINIAPFTDSDARIGISTADMIRIQKHILGVDPFTTPYQLLASDLDGNSQINFIDLIRIRKMILGLETGEDLPKLWYFIPTNFQFQQPETPWSEVIPETIEVPAGANPNNVFIDFVAVKVGDANYSLSGNVEARSQRLVHLLAKDQQLEPGQFATLEIKISNSENLDAAQFALDIDQSQLELLSYELEGGLSGATEVDYAQYKALKTVWMKEPTTEKVVTLQLRAKTQTTLSKAIQLNDRLLSNEAFAQEIHPLDLIFEEADTPLAFQIGANPFLNQTEIRFAKAIQGEIQIFNQNGQMVWSSILDDASTVAIHKQDLGPAGVYIFSVRSQKNTWTGKLICQ